MAYTLNDLAVIEKAIASGASEVRFGDRMLRRPSIDELLKARTDIQTDLDAAKPSRVRQIRFVTDKGF